MMILRMIDHGGVNWFCSTGSIFANKIGGAKVKGGILRGIQRVDIGVGVCI
jgi:hypothetical protein